MCRTLSKYWWVGTYLRFRNTRLFPLSKVINFYLSLITERSSGQAAELKVYSFSTFFFPKLRGRGSGLAGHSEVKRWTKAVDLFSYDLVLVPLHLGVHWALAVSHTYDDYNMFSMSWPFFVGAHCK